MFSSISFAPSTLVAGRRLSALGRLALFAEIMIAYVDARRGMGRDDIRRTVARARGSLLVSCERTPDESLAERRLAIRLALAVDRTLRMLPTDSRCLIQALVLTRVLAARNVYGSVVIGAHRQPEFQAHAWVELSGTPIQSPGDFTDSILISV